MLRDADTAMYGRKSSGKARDAVFDQDMHDRAVALLRLETDLRRAIERSEFEIYYQPIVSLESGKIDAFEALLRWRHPRRGLAPPRQLRAGRRGHRADRPHRLVGAARGLQPARGLAGPAAGRRALAVTVNLSSKQFMQADLVERLQGILRKTGLGRESLRLEITESTIMEQAEDAVGQADGRCAASGSSSTSTTSAPATPP